MKTAIIGAGHIAKIHAPLIQGLSGTTLAAVADSDTSRAAAFAAEHGIDSWYEAATAMIEEHEPDVVHIVVPPQYHAALAIMAMDRGCHVFVEKPLSLSRIEGERILAAAQRNGVNICVNHNFLYEALVQRALELVRTGAIGDVISVEASFLYDLNRNPALCEEHSTYAHWAFRLNGGPLQDMIPHPASLIAEFVDDIKDVHVARQNHGRLPAGFSDEVRILLESQRVFGIINLSLNERPDTVSLLLRGSEGSLGVDLFSNTLTLQRRFGVPRAIARGLSGFRLGLQQLRGSARNVWNVASGRIDKSGGIGPLISAFYASIRDNIPEPVPPEKALQVVELIEQVWPEPCAGSKKVAAAVSDDRSRRSAHPPTALLTGASGFIGSQLLSRLLGDGECVRALVRPNSPRAGRVRRLDAEFFEADLADKPKLTEAVQGVDTVFHLGGAVNDKWQEHRVTTVEATATLLEAAIKHGVKRFIYVSTLALCDTTGAQDGGRITEEIGYTSELGPYARAKMEAEQLVLNAGRRGLAATIIRPGIVMGPRGKVLFPHIGYAFKDRLFVMIGKGNIPLPLTYVENTVDALCRAARSPAAAGQTYHIVDNGGVTAAEYLGMLVDVAGLRSRIIHVPFSSAYLAAGSYELASNLRIVPRGITSREQLRQKRKAVIFDCSKATSELGWYPKVPMREGLQQTFEWYGRQKAQ